MPTLKYVNPLVLVADASRAQFFTFDDEAGKLVECATLINNVGRASEQDLGADRQGRSFDSQGSGRHAMEAKTSAKDHAMQGFAQQVAEEVPRQLAGTGLRNLVLIAAPRFLGVLRKALSEDAKAALYCEIDGEYTTHTPQQIAEVVAKKLA
jgi:protein required for attachment to host cells